MSSQKPHGIDSDDCQRNAEVPSVAARFLWCTVREPRPASGSRHCWETWGIGRLSYGADKEPIKVGVLHSLSGTMAISEVSLKDVVSMAVEEINAKGGLLGTPAETGHRRSGLELGSIRRKGQTIVGAR